MPTMGETIAREMPRAAQPGELPFSGGEYVWQRVADEVGADGFQPLPLPEDNPADSFKPEAAQLTAAAETTRRPDVPRSGYLLGGVAVEAAGVTRADALPGEAATRARYRRFLGGVAMHASTVGTAEAPTPAHRSSLDLLRDAAAGDNESRAALLTDAQTHVYEVTGGVGEGMAVRLEIGERGPEWAGQNDEARQFHTLTSYSHSPQMLKVRHAEGMGSFRLTDRHAEGQLKSRAVFDFSAMARASQEELAAAGHFLNSIGVCIRRNTFGTGQEISSVFVAGVDQRDFKPQKGETEAQEAARQSAALQERFDIKVLRKMYGLFGVEGAGHMEPDELLATQLVTPEGFDELDMAMLYDQLATEEMEEGVQTFFGSVELWQQIGSPEHTTREHYEAHMRGCEQRQAGYRQLCEDVVEEQIRRQHLANTPLEAAELKRRVVLDLLVDRAIDVGDVDASRLGREAVALAHNARSNYASGNKGDGNRLRTKAKEKAIDPSCPPGERNKKGAGEGHNSDADNGCNEIRDGDPVHCPYCDQNVRAIVPQEGGRIYCSNKRCTAAFYKGTVQEKLFEKNKNNAPKQPFFRPFGASAKPNDNKKVDKP